ncbi:MAG: DUF4249 domain-containing protein [Cyclobacteriaceae bacterium]
MIKLRKHILPLICGLLLLACVEPFTPNIPNSNQSFIVVDGTITDQPGPYTVSLSKSAELANDTEIVSGAAVYIEEENGVSEQLTESSNGKYVTSNIQGKVGNKYRLTFTYEGQQYESAWETLPASATLDSIYFQGESRGAVGSEEDIVGVQFFVDNHSADVEPKYFRFQWSETWKYNSFWQSYYDYVGNDESVATLNPLHTCWGSKQPVGINLATTENLIENRISRHKLGFITGFGERFTIKYSQLVSQYTISENEYFFWKNLQESNEELGNLFDKQPAKVIGNIINVTNPDEPVLGYFSASGLIEKRIFVTNREVPIALIRRIPCTPLDTLLKSDFGDEYEAELQREINESGKFFYDFVYNDFSPFPIGAFLALPGCADCRKKGGVPTKPEFWDD